MKACPTCNRTYSDDTFTFCLNDGALLSAPYDPKATLIIPSAEIAQLPPPENMTPASSPANVELPVTIQALPLLAGMGQSTETEESAEAQGLSGATIVTMILLVFGSLVLTVFLARC